jgi:hypothetical protein
VHDDFFELGGHSLLATQLVARIEARWQRALPVEAIFTAPTLEALAQRIDAAQPAARPPVQAIARRARRSPGSGGDIEVHG